MSDSPAPVKSPAPPTHDFNVANFEGLFIGISGLIGAGKSTLATALAKELGLPVYYEPVVDNVYLADFYQDMAKYSFPLQIYLLNKRFKQQQQIIWEGRGGVQDRTIYEDSVFARMLRDSGAMEERDFNTYMELFGNMSNFMKKPNIIVHLDLTPEESIRRIKLRNRECEAGISLEYMRSLHAAYESFIADIARVIPVIKVDYSRFRTAEEMAVMIRHEYTQIANIRHVGVNSSSYTSPPSSPLPPSPPSVSAGVDDVKEKTKVLVQTNGGAPDSSEKKVSEADTTTDNSIAVNKEAEFDRQVVSS